MIRFAALPALCLLVAACGDDPAPAEETQENLDARGEVLGGTISDDMLPLDTLTSQAPSQAVPRQESVSEEPSEPETPSEPEAPVEAEVEQAIGEEADPQVEETEG